MSLWIANGLSQDLPPGVVMAGAWQGADLAIWRSGTGRLAAWGDRCPHRGMRLSHGFVRGETLSCIYHGWTYGADGGCQKIPAHPAMVPPAAIKAETYQCVEEGGLIWVAPADTAVDLPDLTGLTPVRSVTLRADRAALTRALPEAVVDGDLWRLAALGVVLALQDRAEGLGLHALCRDPALEVQLSRWLDGLLRLAEQGEAA